MRFARKPRTGQKASGSTQSKQIRPLRLSHAKRTDAHPAIPARPLPPPCPLPCPFLTCPPSPKAATPPRSFRNSRDLAQHAETWGYRRFWLAEHHGMPGIASAATSILIAHIAGATSRIPGRRWRHHVAQPFPAGHRRAVRHTGVAVSRPHRSRARACALNRSAHRARAAPQPSIRVRTSFHRTSFELMDFMSDAPRQAVRGAGHGAESAGLDPRIEPVRCTTGRGAGFCHTRSHPISAPAQMMDESYHRATRSNPRRSWTSPM